MSAAVSQIGKIRLVVCAECLPGVLEGGGEEIRGPHHVQLDTKCEAHGPVGAIAGSHVVEVSREHDQRIMDARRHTAIAPLDYSKDDPADVDIVAGVAATILTRLDLDPSSDDAIHFAVTRARRVLAAARGK